MTCVVAVTDGRKVVVGADSASVDEESWQLELVRTPKVCRHGEVVIGFCGGWGIGHRLRNDLEVTELGRTSVGVLVEEHIAPAIWDVLDGESDWDVCLALRGRLFHVSHEEYVQEPRDSFLAIGSGASAARGALMAMTHAPQLSLRTRTHRALLAAEADSAGVRRPFRYRGA